MKEAPLDLAVLPAGADPEVFKKEAVLELARREFLPFVMQTFLDYKPDPFHQYVAWRLEMFYEQCRLGLDPRLMLLAPPQHGKSELVSRRFPAWVLGKQPDWRVMLISYGAELAEENSGDVRATVRSDEYAEIFGTQSVLDPEEQVEIEKTRKSVQAWRLRGKRGGLVAAGVGGAITGRGANIIIIDDPVKGRAEADSETYREAAWSWYPQARDRLQHGGGILLIMTPWHYDDLGGRLRKLADEDPKADQWEVIRFPAIAEEDDILGRAEGEPLAPSRYTLEDLEKLQATIGRREWTAKYQCRPSPEEGGIFDANWFIRVGPREEKPIMAVQFWDTAFTKEKRSDYSVGGTWHVYRDRFRLDSAVYGRWTFPEVKRKAAEYYRSVPIRPRAVVIEAVQAGKALVQEFQRETRLPVLTYVPDRDKVARAHAITPLLEAGRVEIPKEAPWWPILKEQALAFPEFEHDDWVDMLTMALICMGVYDIRVRNVNSIRRIVFSPGRG